MKCHLPCRQMEGSAILLSGYHVTGLRLRIEALDLSPGAKSRTFLQPHFLGFQTNRALGGSNLKRAVQSLLLPSSRFLHLLVFSKPSPKQLALKRHKCQDLPSIPTR